MTRNLRLDWCLAWGWMAGLLATSLLAHTAGAEEYLDPSVEVRALFSDGRFTEGPAIDRQGNVYFSDSPNDRIMKLDREGKVTVFRQPCGATNGMKFDAQGRLVMCQSKGAKGKRRVARLEADGTETPLAETYDGIRFHAPNDLTIDLQGRIYFSDLAVPEPDKLLEMASGVYRIDAPGKVVRVIDNLERPNGLVISPDNRLLYVSDRGTQKVHRYRVDDRGDLTPDGILYDFSPDRGIDGMCLDTQGNVVAAAGINETTGLFVISPTGKLICHRPMPEFSTNVCFAGDDLRDLYFTAGKSLYKLRTRVAGIVPVCRLPSSGAAESR